jgi:hypothetical protein
MDTKKKKKMEMIIDTEVYDWMGNLTASYVPSPPPSSKDLTIERWSETEELQRLCTRRCGWWELLVAWWNKNEVNDQEDDETTES